MFQIIKFLLTLEVELLNGALEVGQVFFIINIFTFPLHTHFVLPKKLKL